jgi:hypothetical protein
MELQPKEGKPMHAKVGDRIVIKGHRVGEPDRDCEVLEVRGPDGGAPFLVRWGDSGHEALFFPGSDAFVQHYEPAKA